MRTGTSIATRARTRRGQPEFRFHCDVADYLDKALPASCWWTTFPSGGGGKVRGGKLKAVGLKAGVPDIMILHRDGTRFQILWLELKAPNGRLSPAQAVFVRAMYSFQPSVGFAVCRTLEDVEAACVDAEIPMRAHVQARAA